MSDFKNIKNDNNNITLENRIQNLKKQLDF